MNDPENLETEQNPERSVEKKFEIKAEHYDRAVELLENPADNNFQQGLQVFIAWVKALLADDN